MSDMEAGRKLDALIARDFFGWTVTVWKEAGFDEAIRVWAPGLDESKGMVYGWNDDNPTTIAGGDLKNSLPHYSTDIRAAWDLVEAMRAHGTTEVWSNRVACVCAFRDHRASAETAPLAICRAALATRYAPEPRATHPREASAGAIEE